jgi:hypothetical protein
LAAPYGYRALAGTAGSVISAGSVGSLDFGIHALSLTVGSTATFSFTGSVPSATSNANVSVPVVTTSTLSHRIKQATKLHKNHLHDHALASLQNIGKTARKGVWVVS